MSASRRRRPAGTLPRPLAFLAAGALAVATGAAISLLPARAVLQPQPGAERPPVPSVTPSPTPAPTPPPGPSGFLTFVDTAADPGFDLPADARRTGVRWYLLGHLRAAAGGCAQRWAGRLAFGHDPVAAGVGRLRALGGDAGLVFAGETAATCTDQRTLAAAYRSAIGAFDARFVHFEPAQQESRETVRRRARVIRTLQAERPLRVGFTLRLRDGGIAARDAELLRITQEAGAAVDTVNVLAGIEPPDAPPGRLGRMAKTVRAAREQIEKASRPARPRLALTLVLSGPQHLNAADARKLAAFATRHRLAWLSLRGADPGPDVARVLHR